MADEGGVTLRIDANTAAYIAKLSQLADSHEKVTKHIDEWGTAAEHFMGKIAAMAGPLVLVEELVRHTKEGFESWQKHLEAAGKTASTLVDTLRRTTVQTGENRQEVENQLMGVASPQLAAERVAGFNAFRQNAPGSAARVSAKEIAEKMGQATVAGYDATQLAGIAGNVEGVSPGAKSFDLGALLLSKTGSNADAASGLIRRLGEKAGPGGAQAALPYLLASAQAGDRRFSFLTEAENAYTPAQGDFGSFMQRRLATAKPDQRGLAASISGRLAEAQRDVSGLDGFIDQRAGIAIGDEKVRARVGTATRLAAAEAKNYGANDRDEEDRARREANLANIESVGGAEAVVAGAIHPLSVFFNRAFGGRRGIDTTQHHKHFWQRGDDDSPSPERLTELLEEQNAIIRDRQLRAHAHDDHEHR